MDSDQTALDNGSGGLAFPGRSTIFSPSPMARLSQRRWASGGLETADC